MEAGICKLDDGLYLNQDYYYIRSTSCCSSWNEYNKIYYVIIFMIGVLRYVSLAYNAQGIPCKTPCHFVFGHSNNKFKQYLSFINHPNNNFI